MLDRTTTVLVLLATLTYAVPAQNSDIVPRDGAVRNVVVVDTMAPQLRRIVSCGALTVIATEVRNIPDPPRRPPGDFDQVELGISSIEFMEDDTLYGRVTTNCRLINVSHPDGFPREPVVAEAQFRIEVIDKSRRAAAWFIVTDWADNSVIDSTSFTPDSIVSSPAQVDFGYTQAGTTVEQRVTVRNHEPDSVTITNGEIFGAPEFSLQSIQAPLRLGPGDSTTIVITYAPTTPSSGPTDLDTAHVILTACGFTRFTVTGLCAAANLVVFDRTGTTARTLVGTTRCDTLCVIARNNSLAPITIASVSIVQHDEIDLSDVPSSELTIQPSAAIPIGTICYSPMNDGADTTMVVVTTAGTISTTWTAPIRRTATATSSVTEPLDLPSDVTIIDHVVHAREHTYTVTVYDLLGRVLQTGVVRPGESLKITEGYVVVLRP